MSSGSFICRISNLVIVVIVVMMSFNFPREKAETDVYVIDGRIRRSINILFSLSLCSS